MSNPTNDDIQDFYDDNVNELLDDWIAGHPEAFTDWLYNKDNEALLADIKERFLNTRSEERTKFDEYVEAVAIERLSGDGEREECDE